jgi:hypothetical protein
MTIKLRLGYCDSVVSRLVHSTSVGALYNGSRILVTARTCQSKAKVRRRRKNIDLLSVTGKQISKPVVVAVSTFLRKSGRLCVPLEDIWSAFIRIEGVKTGMQNFKSLKGCRHCAV